MGGKLDGVRDTVVKVTTPQPQTPEPPDYDSMSQAELAAHLHGSMSSVIQDAIKAALAPVTEQLGRLNTDVSTTRGSLELRDVQSKFKDFREWKDEMVALVKDHPTLTFEKVYHLARAESPDKAKTLDAKYNPAPAKPRPGSGSAALRRQATGGGEPTPLTGEEATKAAYAEVSGRAPWYPPSVAGFMIRRAKQSEEEE